MLVIQGMTTLPTHTAQRTQFCDGFQPSWPSGSGPTLAMSWRSPRSRAACGQHQSLMQSSLEISLEEITVSTIYFSPFFTGFFSRKVFLHFSHEFSRENIFSRKFLSIFSSRFLTRSLEFSRLFLCTFLSTVPKISDFRRLKA